MAGDWIKVELTTPDKPEVVVMATLPEIDQDAVVGKLFRLWAWAYQNSIDGEGVMVTKSFIDRLTNYEGFARAGGATSVSDLLESPASREFLSVAAEWKPCFGSEGHQQSGEDKQSPVIGLDRHRRNHVGQTGKA
jgi:hypothetical protein